MTIACLDCKKPMIQIDGDYYCKECNKKDIELRNEFVSIDKGSEKE